MDYLDMALKEEGVKIYVDGNKGRRACCEHVYVEGGIRYVYIGGVGEKKGGKY